MKPLVYHCPAKLNLFLAITGRRPDGFHDLVSVATPTTWGDTLTVEERERGFTLTCSDPALEIDETNLVLRAAKLFAETTGWKGGAHFSLEKRIPVGAGLGGGSSNATTTLQALNALAGTPLGRDALAQLAARIGSDCALFLHGGPVVMRGRGERVDPLADVAAKRLRGRRVLVFKPPFGISTVWAYRQIAAGAPASYLPVGEAEAKLDAWLRDVTAPAEDFLYNNMEAPAFEKYIALPVALGCLRDEFQLRPRMSGSGSACFAFLREDAPVAEISRRLRELWGDEAFVVETRLA